MNNLYIVKTSVLLTSLIQDISLVSKNITYQYQVSVGDLRFARRGKFGYQFLGIGEQKIKILLEVVEQVMEKYPQTPRNKIVDLLSELVNLTVSEVILLTNKTPASIFTPEEQDFSNQCLLTLSDNDTYLPRYPWFMPLNSSGMPTWKAKDLVTNTEVSIKKTKRGKFYEYEIKQQPT